MVGRIQMRIDEPDRSPEVLKEGLSRARMPERRGWSELSSTSFRYTNAQLETLKRRIPSPTRRSPTGGLGSSSLTQSNAFTWGERCSGQLSSAQSGKESQAMKPQELRFCRLPAAASLCGDPMSTARLGRVDLGGWLQFGRKRFFRVEQILIALGLSQKLLAFRTRLIFFCRLKFADDDLVQLFDGPMRYRFPAHGPIETLILVLDQSTLVPYFYGCDQCFLRVRSFGITHWLVRSLFFNRRPRALLPAANLRRDARNVLAKGE
jgi:hypothetical protein